MAAPARAPKRDAGQQHGGDRGAALARGDAIERKRREQPAAEGPDRQRPRTGSRPTSGARSVSPSTIVTAAARAAPAETPTRPGSASGLRNRPCMSAPETASAAPTSPPSSRRGSRIWNRTSASRRITADGCADEGREDAAEGNADGAGAERYQGARQQQESETSERKRLPARPERCAPPPRGKAGPGQRRRRRHRPVPPATPLSGYSAARRSRAACGVRGPKPSR